jgi:hypothetical protein
MAAAWALTEIEEPWGPQLAFLKSGGVEHGQAGAGSTT